MDGRSFLPLVYRNRNIREKWPDTFLIESSGRRETAEHAESKARLAARKYSALTNVVNLTNGDSDANLGNTTNADVIDFGSHEHEDDDEDDDGE